jgi:signal peptidase I
MKKSRRRVDPVGLMKPTLHIGDRIIVDKLSVELGTIDTGDIVVFKAPPAEHCEGSSTIDLVKRVIGVPGDHLTSEGKTIFVNGRPRHEKWPHWELLGGAIGIVTVPPDQYFVVGDNHATRATAERGVPCRVQTSSPRRSCESGRSRASDSSRPARLVDRDNGRSFRIWSFDEAPCS